MAKREFDDDRGVVGELQEFGGLMPVMEGRRSDYARVKQLKENGLYDRLSELARLTGLVHEEWTAVYGAPNSKKFAQDAISKRPATASPTYEEISDALRLMVHVHNHVTTRDALRTSACLHRPQCILVASQCTPMRLARYWPALRKISVGRKMRQPCAATKIMSAKAVQHEALSHSRPQARRSVLGRDQGPPRSIAPFELPRAGKALPQDVRSPAEGAVIAGREVGEPWLM